MEVVEYPGFFTIKLTRELNHPAFYKFIEALKVAVPGQKRQYDPDNKTWDIPMEYRHTVGELHREHFEDKNQIRLFD